MLEVNAMKSLMKCTLVLVVLIFVVGCAERVQFADPSLAVAITGKRTGIFKSDLAEWRRLNVSNKDIVYLTGIEHCISLERLHAWLNRIDDINPLSSLTKLQYLKLRYNKITDVSPLAKLTELQILYLDNNRIINIAAIEGLPNIGQGDWDGIMLLQSDGYEIHLGLSNNQISDISPLVKNSGIGEGDVIDLRGNPLNDEAYSVHIPILQERGVEVLFSPEQRE